MCGIAGLFSKSTQVSDSARSPPRRHALQLSDRGPDSAGIAVYREPAPVGACKVSLHPPTPAEDWVSVSRAGEASARATPRYAEPCRDRGSKPTRATVTRGSGALSRAARDERRGRPSRSTRRPGLPREFLERFALSELSGEPRSATPGWPPRAGHHRRLAPLLDRPRPVPGPQRVAVQPQPAAPRLRAEGIEFQTENDTEVAAGYLTWRLREGATLEAALEGCLEDLDGFYTFAVGRSTASPCCAT